MGDSVIRMVGQVFRQQVRLGDVAARIGGDEFVVLMPFTGTSEALELVKRLQRDFSQALAVDQRLLGTSLSFGIAAPQADMKSHGNWMEPVSYTHLDVYTRQAQCRCRAGLPC